MIASSVLLFPFVQKRSVLVLVRSEQSPHDFCGRPRLPASRAGRESHLYAPLYAEVHQQGIGVVWDIHGSSAVFSMVLVLFCGVRRGEFFFMECGRSGHKTILRILRVESVAPYDLWRVVRSADCILTTAVVRFRLSFISSLVAYLYSV